MRPTSRKVPWAIFILIAGMILLLVSMPVRAATPQQVDEAIRKGVDSLYSRQNNGNWEEVQTPEAHEDQASVKSIQWGGMTALATYALLAAGESPQDPRLKKAIEFVASAEIRGTYALGMRAQIWNFLSQTPAVHEMRKRDAEMLMRFCRTKPGESQGLYGYMQAGDGYDHSCSNYGVLGMWAVGQANLEIPTQFWQAFDTAWRNHQYEDGSWSYKFLPNGPPANDEHAGRHSMSLTSAGVATLFITQDFLNSARGINCVGNIVDENIERGLKWMSAHFDEFHSGDRPYYTIYNIERVGVASGYKYFGTVDWYKTGSDFLVQRQDKDSGAWSNNGAVIDTSWAILFLVRGRAPVMLNKLDYSGDTKPDPKAKPKAITWNQRPRDAANISRWVGKQMERDLNWQVVNLNVPIDDLHDAPILYISGSEALNLKPEDEAKIKQFIEQGGLVVGNADCGRKPFADSFRKVGTKLFGYEFRNLPDEHPIFVNEQYRRVAWRTKPLVVGLSNGARELMILFPLADPAKGWQTQAFLGAERDPLWQVMADIFLYAVDKQNLRFKGETYIVRPDGGGAGKNLKVARLQYPGAWDPEPGGWRRLNAVMHNQRQTDLAVEMVKLGEGKLDPSFAVAHLTGTGRFSLTDSARAEIRKYVEGGGTLVVDSCGGGPEFTLAAETELTKAFTGQKWPNEALPASHPLYSAAYKIEEVEYRAYARKIIGGSRLPRLRAMMIAGRPAVIISPEDLSVGLVGQPVDGIIGYVPSAQKLSDGRERMGATEIMANIILYAAENRATVDNGRADTTTQPAKDSAPVGEQR